MPLYRIMQRDGLDYLYWSMPGIYFICSSIVCMYFSISQIMKLKNTNNPSNSILKSPISIWEVIIANFLSIIIIGIIQLFIGIITLNIINQGHYSLLSYFFVIINIIAFISFITALNILFGLLINSELVMIFIIMIQFIIISFGMGSLIPIELFPEQLSNIIINIPMVHIIINTQSILMLEPITLFASIITFIISIVLLTIDTIIAYKVLRK